AKLKGYSDLRTSDVTGKWSGAKTFPNGIRENTHRREVPQRQEGHRLNHRSDCPSHRKNQLSHRSLPHPREGPPQPSRAAQDGRKAASTSRLPEADRSRRLS